MNGRTNYLLVLLVVIMTGCNSNHYELSKDSQGRTIRLNKNTGEVSIIEGDTITALKTDQDIKKEKQQDAVLNKPKNWAMLTIPQLNKVGAFLETVWRDNQLFYQFQIIPDSDRIDKARNNVFSNASLTVELFDSNGFATGEIIIPLHQLTQVVDSNGKGTGFSKNSSIFMSKNDYLNSTGWNIKWSGFN